MTISRMLGATMVAGALATTGAVAGIAGAAASPSSATSAVTNATFSSAGTYVLQLTATNSSTSASATTTITNAMPSTARLTSSCQASWAKDPPRLAAAIQNRPPVAARCASAAACRREFLR